MSAKNVRAFLIDCDGTLTDGCYEYHDNGNISKRFHTRDMYALSRLKSLGFCVCVISACKDNATKLRMEASNIEFVQTGIFKQPFADAFLQRNNLTWDQAAFIGDAEVDLECMRASGFAACPKDSIPEVLSSVNYVSVMEGGRAAVYDIARYVCKLQDIDWFSNEAVNDEIRSNT